MNKNNIVLIGMPGAGKSTVGVVLAKILGMDFIDTDLLIQKSTGKKLYELISELGIEGFIELEGKINSEVTGNNQIIATGGSVIYSDKAMKSLSEIGTIVYISLTYEAIKSRLKNLTHRGVVLKENQNLYDLYRERNPLYQKYAGVTVDVKTEFDIPDTVDAILNTLTDHNIL